MSVQGSGEVRGVERTGEVARMLPSEAVLLTHPLLRGLWHAKRAERALLGYHAVGVMTSRIQTWTSQEELQEEETPADRGPIILILDTSGSMFGFRSTIAKAVALQVMAVAHAEERPCFGLNFSGPGDLLELELTFDGDGLTRLIRFVSSSFDGGTCPAEALAAASRRLHQGDWRKADIVLVSDGEWLPEPATMKRLARARRIHGVVRWHGVRVGGGPGFDALGCDTVHDVREWLP